MSHPFDAYDDVNRQQLYALDRLCGLPDFVKRAADEPRDALKTLPSSVFADVPNRKFPCHTKEATWLANAYFQQNRQLYSKAQADSIQDGIDKFASYFKIVHLVKDHNRRWEKIATYGTPELPDDDYALVYKLDNGMTVRRMPMPNALAVKQAGEYLFANRFMYTYGMRKAAALKILKRAMDIDEGKLAKQAQEASVQFVPGELRFDYDTQEFLEKAAGCGATHVSWAAEKIAQRALMMPKDSAYRTKLAALAKHVNELQRPSREQFIKLAEAIDAVDRETGISDHYSNGVDLPEEIFFKVTVKQAEEARGDYITLQNDKMLPIEVLNLVPVEKIAAVMGQDFVDAISEDGKVDMAKFAEIAPTLPRDDANLLTKMIDVSIEKTAREHRGGNPENFNKASMVDFFKKRGNKVEDRDYQFTAKP